MHVFLKNEGSIEEVKKYVPFSDNTAILEVVSPDGKLQVKVVKEREVEILD